MESLSKRKELISAYSDGEATSEERLLAEGLLASDTDCRRFFAALQHLQDGFRTLPRHQLSRSVTDRIVAEVERMSATGGLHEVPDAEAELLSAYLDNEVTADEAGVVESLLAASLPHRQMLVRLRTLDQNLRRMSPQHLDPGFTDRVLTRIAGAAGTEEPQVELASAPATAEAKSPAARRDRRVAWAALAAAAALLVMTYILSTSDRPADQIAETPPVAPATGGAKVPPQPTPDAIAVGPTAVTPVDAQTGREPPPLGPEDGSREAWWNLVQSVQRESPLHLVMVYEVTVTPEGVANAAFANLLRRHGIRFHQALPIDEREQKALLKHRFLEGVEVGAAGSAEMDNIELYLVACTGRQGDAMYNDIMMRPPGLGSFHMNLTTREANDGALNRLCDASGIADRSNEAVQLLANFAILSRSARQLGVFGSIRWVEPELLEPPAPKDTPGGAAQKIAPPGTNQALLRGDFKCEILFVVRNLQDLGPAQKADR